MFSSLLATDSTSEQKRTYEQHCREMEHGSFTPLVMSAPGGLANEASCHVLQNISFITTGSCKWIQPYAYFIKYLNRYFSKPLRLLGDLVLM